MSETTATETLISTTIAGVTAGCLEAFVTYPLEYIKTRHQLFRHTPGSVFIAPIPSKVYYSGCSALVLGNASKAVVRYSVYNWGTKFMTDESGQASAPQIVVAGMFTGFCESLIVAPFESIKTTMVERSIVDKDYKPATSLGSKNADTKGGERAAGKPVRPPVRPPAAPKPAGPQLFPVNPNVRGFFGNVHEMYTTRGLRAFVQGFGPTITRQMCNSMVRFTTYNSLKQMVVDPSAHEQISSTLALALGLVAGAVQVLSTQPIDVVKTRMQSINGIPAYRSSLLCGYRIFVEEGPTRLWTGTLPRLIRVSFSGGIMFSVYEATNKLVAHGMRENPFASI